MDALEGWVGRSVERRDDIRPWPAQALHETLDRSGPPPRDGDPLPPLWTDLYFPEPLPRAALARDGWPERGAGVTPPTAEPRRVVLGGRLVMRAPLIVGKRATLVETVAKIARRGGLDHDDENEALGVDGTVVTLRKEHLAQGGLATTEELDVLHRPAIALTPTGPLPAPPRRAAAADRGGAVWRRRWTLDPIALFRHAALTWDARRSAFDLDYCREEERLDGLLIPPQLIVKLMLDLAREFGPDRPVARFAWIAHGALTHRSAFEICGAAATSQDGGDGTDLWVVDPGDPDRVLISGRLAYG